MRKRITKKIAGCLGLSMQNLCCQGEYRGYRLAVIAYKHCIVTTISVVEDGTEFDWNSFVDEIKKVDCVEECFYERNALRVRFAGTNLKKYLDFVDDVLIDRVSRVGDRCACCSCGKTDVALKFYEINGKRDFLCRDCVEHICRDIKQKKISVGNECSNLFTGLTGALAGIMTGLFLWILSSNIGLNGTFASGFMMFALCFGYVLLGGAMDRKGVLFCLILGIFSCIFGIVLQFIHLVHRTYYGVVTYSYFDSIQMIPQIYERMEMDIRQAFILEDLSTLLSSFIVLIVCLRIFYYKNKHGMVFRKM